MTHFVRSNKGSNNMNIRSFVVTAVVGFGLFLFAVDSAPAQNDVTDIDEEFELNIAEERITETAFARSTQAELSAENVRLRVGVSVEAGSIEVTLRGVTGHVRFRASLERVRQRIARLRSELNIR